VSSPQTGFAFDLNSTRLPVKTAFINTSSSGHNALVAGVPGRKIRVLAYRLQAGGTVNLKFTDGTNDLSMTWEFQAREGVAVEAPDYAFEFETPAGVGLSVNLSGAVLSHAHVLYVEAEN
jgi:hypothetical protein